MGNYEYNKIPVHYCRGCLDLKILILPDSSIDYCGKCGNTDIGKCSNTVWEEKYKERYGKYYLKT